MSPTTRVALVRRLRQLGWDGPRTSKGHDYMVKGPRKVHIPNPHQRKDIGVSLLREILRQAGVSRAEWLGTPD
ncbi:MAG: type II toxin-antitoxin system HicA family toxin [Chloroflexota bacterium]|nr:type II toxin-antitoxin system HicA family toxin [Chloroflexota bacterium]